MAAEKRRLGRGLSDLLGGVDLGSGQGDFVDQYPVDQLIPNPDQPRENFDPLALEQLTASIQTMGVLQPLLARREGDTAVIIAGERRYRAALAAGLRFVPVRFLQADEKLTQEMALVENLQRENLTSLELASALKDLLDRWGMTQEELATRLGWSRSALANKTRLLALPLPVREALEDGVISEGHARALLSLSSADEMLKVLEETRRLQWSVRQVEHRVARLKEGLIKEERPKAWRCHGAQKLAQKIGVKIKLRELNGSHQMTLLGLSQDQVKQICSILDQHMPKDQGTIE